MWNYNIPVRIFKGERIIFEKKELLNNFGKKALVITGKNSAKLSGALDDLLKIFYEYKIEFNIFDEVEENPSFETVERGANLFEEYDFDFVVAIGGGSPLDAGKAIAALGSYFQKNADLFGKSDNIYKNTIPIIAIPTTSGSGSEITPYAILTNRENKKKGISSNRLFPVISFLDPRYTLTLNEPLTISTGLDALTHSVEGELKNNGRNPIIKSLSYKSNLMIKENLIDVNEKLSNIDFRSVLQEASTMAGIVISHFGTTIIHSAGYPLSSFKNAKHGISNSVFFVEVLKRIAETDKDRVLNSISPFNSIKELESFLYDLGIEEYKFELTDNEIESWSEDLIVSQKRKKTPGEFDLDFYKSLYNKIRK